MRPRPLSYLWMLIPGLAVYLAFTVYPFLSSLRYSLYNWTGVGALRDFIGLGNYSFIFNPQGFLHPLVRAVLHNVYFFGLSFVLSCLLGFLLAYLLYSVNTRVSAWLQALYFVPYLIPPVVVGYLWSIYLEPGFGAISRALNALGLSWLNLPYLGSSRLALPTVVGISAWAGMGFPVLLFLAAMINIPSEILDAAKIDGAGATTTMTRVIFPMLRSTFVTVVTLTWLSSFLVFDLVYVLEGTQAGPNYATDVFGTLFYRTAWGGFGATATGMGLAAATAVVAFFFIMIIAALMVWLQQRLGRD